MSGSREVFGLGLAGQSEGDARGTPPQLRGSPKPVAPSLPSMNAVEPPNGWLVTLFYCAQANYLGQRKAGARSSKSIYANAAGADIDYPKPYRPQILLLSAFLGLYKV